jgi:hypothetical protein
MLHRGCIASTVLILVGTVPDSQFSRLNPLTLVHLAEASTRRLGSRRSPFDREGSDMTLGMLRVRFLGIACALALASGLAGCGASSVAGGSGSSAGTGVGGSSAPAPITGISTPKSVSVVTAN